MASLISDADRSVIHHLRDGTKVTIRLIGRADRERLAAGFEKLSPESRYLRFFSPMPRLPEEVLRRLTDTDGENHVAIGAEVASGDPTKAEGLGVARYFRLRDAPDTAEAAVAVIDEKQGLGLGKLLMRALGEAARERGIRRFRACTLRENVRAIALVEHLDEPFTVRAEGELLIYEVDLPVDDEEVYWGPLYRLLKSAAEGVEFVFQRLTGHG